MAVCLVFVGDPNPCLCFVYMLVVGTAWLLGVIVAGQRGGQSWFVDFVHGKIAGTIDCLLSFVHF